MTNINTSIEALIKSGDPTSVLQAIEVCKTLGLKFAPFVGGESDDNLPLVEELLKASTEVRMNKYPDGLCVVWIKEDPRFKAWEWDGYKEYRSISISEMLGWLPYLAKPIKGSWN